MRLPGFISSVARSFTYCLSRYDVQMFIMILTFAMLTASMVLVLYYYYPVRLDYWLLTTILYTYAVSIIVFKSKFLPGRIVRLASNQILEEYAIFLYAPPGVFLVHVGYEYSWVLSNIWITSRLLETFLVGVLVVMTIHIALILAYVKRCTGGARLVKA